MKWLNNIYLFILLIINEEEEIKKLIFQINNMSFKNAQGRRADIAHLSKSQIQSTGDYITWEKYQDNAALGGVQCMVRQAQSWPSST